MIASYDVIVVGARVAGAATAMLLARDGARTLLIEAPTAPDDRPTLALSRGGVMQLHRWGVLDELIAAGTPPVKRSTYRFGPERVTVSLKSRHGVDALYAPRAGLLARALVHAASDAGADVRAEISFADVTTSGDQVTGVRASTPDDRAVEFSA